VWSSIGNRFYEKKPAYRKNRLSVVGALNQKTFFAPLIFEGTCTKEVFEKWLKEILIPELKPNQVVILDNAAFHTAIDIEALLKSKNCSVKYLPTYSPDMNPIEQHWFCIKNRVRKMLQSTTDGLLNVLCNVLNEMRTSMC